MEHLILTLEAPMMSFGSQVVDHLGPTRIFPSLAALTGLIGNALGWYRTEPQKLQALQDRLVFASRIDRPPRNNMPVMDYQSVEFDPGYLAWTTSGVPEGRTGSKQTLENKHLRYREFLADARIIVAARVEPHSLLPSHDQLAQALRTPARPLFIGRKPFIPSTPIYQGTAEADTALQALLDLPADNPEELPPIVNLSWPTSEGHPANPDVVITAQYNASDNFNWRTRMHSGTRRVFEGTAPAHIFQGAAA